MNIDSATPKVSIIIPVFDDTFGLEVTLRSIQNVLAVQNHAEVIVCNDGGGDVISSLISSYGAKEALLEINRGPAAARNAGILLSQAEIIAFLDADQEISPTWLENGLNALTKSDYAGGAISVVCSNENDWWEKKDQIMAFPVESCIKNYRFAPTANLFIRRHVLQTIGCFDERLRFAEDLDFGERVYNAGFRQLFVSNAITYHPARNKIQQLKKMATIGQGSADKLCIIDGRKPLLVIAIALFGFAKLPLELTFRIIKCALFPGPYSRKFMFAAILMNKYCKIFLLFRMAQRAHEHMKGI